jgi:mono/diheme cytochrome c family protein
MRHGSLLAAAAVVLLTAAPAMGAGASRTEVDAGRRVFGDHCAMCHGSDASGMMGMHPSLRGAVERLTVEGVDVTVRKGRDTDPPMPAFEGRLSDQEIRKTSSPTSTRCLKGRATSGRTEEG